MRRVGLFALVLLVLDESTAFAHGTESSSGERGVSIPLLVAGLALAGAALAVRTRTSNPFAIWAPVMLGGALAIASVLVTTGDDRPDVHIAIVEPSAATVPAEEAIAVRVTVDAQIASSPDDTTGGHLHLSVDGALQQMPYATSADVTLTPGPHTITVEYVDNQHLSFDPPIQDSVDVTAEIR